MSNELVAPPTNLAMMAMMMKTLATMIMTMMVVMAIMMMVILIAVVVVIAMMIMITSIKSKDSSIRQFQQQNAMKQGLRLHKNKHRRAFFQQCRGSWNILGNQALFFKNHFPSL